MKRFWLLSVFFLFSVGSAVAAQPDCNSLMFFGSSLVYKTVASFPNDPESKSLYFMDAENPVKPQRICGVMLVANPKAQSLQMSAKSWPEFHSYFAGHVNHAVGNQLVIINQSATDSGLGDMHRFVFDPSQRTINYLAKSNAFHPLSVGVKIDGGKLLPLYYNSKSTLVTYPAGSKVINVYVKSDEGVRMGWKRVILDLKNTKVTLFKNATMPAQ